MACLNTDMCQQFEDNIQQAACGTERVLFAGCGCKQRSCCCSFSLIPRTRLLSGAGACDAIISSSCVSAVMLALTCTLWPF